MADTVMAKDNFTAQFTLQSGRTELIKVAKGTKGILSMDGAGNDEVIFETNEWGPISAPVLSRRDAYDKPHVVTHSLLVY